MATTVNIVSNYVGKQAGDIIGQSYMEIDTLAKGLVDVLPNINFKAHLRKIAYTNGRQAYACGFTPTGTINLSEKTLEPKKFKVELQICKEDFRQTWSEDGFGASAWNKTMASDIKEAIMAEVLAANSEQIALDIWNGDDSALQFNGLIPQMLADTDVVKPTATTITDQNVRAELAKVMNAIPLALQRENLIWAVSPDVANAYSLALINAGINNGLGGNANTGLTFGRYTLTVVNELPANTIVVYKKGNLVLATGLQADFNEIQVVDEDEIGLMTGQVRFKMVFNGDTGYYNSEDIVLYTTEELDEGDEE